MGQAFVDRLTPVLVQGDVDEARALLDDLDGEDLREARAWFAQSTRWFRQLHELPFVAADSKERFRRLHAAMWIQGMCAVRLAGPVTAVKRVPWLWYSNYRTDEGEAAFVHLLWDADHDWAADFVEAASHLRLGGNARMSDEGVARILRAVAVHHGLPCPTGPTFITRWWAGTGTHASLAEKLAADPFMPDLLMRYLSGGSCGDLGDLPAAVAELVERGVVDRAEVLGQVLESLTGAQRPGSQKVLAQVAAALDLSTPEVPGGLTYLLGVLTTADRSVVAILLPLAIDAVTGAADLEELTRVVASRPEKRPRTMLLDALGNPRTVAIVGTQGVLTALAGLRTGDDSAFDAQVDRAAAALGAPTREPDPTMSQSLGLWDLEPQPSSTPSETRMGRRPLLWDDVLRSDRPRRRDHQPAMVDAALASMAAGTFGDGAPLLEGCRALLAANQLNVRSLCAVLEDLFLGGGLRHTWPVALTLADDMCAASPRPSGLADLLRTLVRYAPEVPSPWSVPAGVRALARSKGATKARAEARVLAAALVGVPGSALDEALEDAPPQTATAPRPRGLWGTRTPALRALPSNRRLVPAGEMEGLDELGEMQHRLTEEFRSPPPDYTGMYFTTDEWMARRPGIWSTDLALASVVRAIHRHGSQPVRAAFAEVERTWVPPGDVLLAVDVWAGGALDVAAFWRVAGARVAGPEDLYNHWRPQVFWNEVQERIDAMPPFAERLAGPDHPEFGALVVPRELQSGAERLHFLRAAEALLRADEQEVLLSTPTRGDGTLDLDDLLGRLALVRQTPDATIGPVDLVQALHRLRPVEPERAAEVPNGPRTDARFTDADGVDSWDAGAMVRDWVAAGGLPPLDPTPDDAGGWCTSAVAPVPFTVLAALPPDLRTDPWSPGPPPATARMMPLWPDRTVATAFAQLDYFVDHLFHGHLATAGGLPLHDQLIAAMESDGSRHGSGAWMSGAEFAQRGRLDPRTFGTAGLARHRAGALRVARLVSSLRLAFEVPGAFPRCWVAGVVLADALCQVDDPPEELSYLLRVVTTYAPEVPSSYVAEAPPGIGRAAEIAAAPSVRTAAAGLVAALAQPREVG